MGGAHRIWGIFGVVVGAAAGCSGLDSSDGNPRGHYDAAAPGAVASRAPAEGADSATAAGSAAHAPDRGRAAVHDAAAHAHDSGRTVVHDEVANVHDAGRATDHDEVAHVHDAGRATDHDDAAHAHSGRATDHDDTAHAHSGRAAIPVGAEAPPTRLELNVDADAGELVLRLGPVELHGGHTMTQTPLLATSLPFATTVTGFEVVVRDAVGRQLPQTLLHHVNVLVPDRSDVFRPVAQRLVAAGSETERIELPWPFGVPVDAGQELLVYGMVHDPDGIAASPVTVEMRLPYTGRRRQAVQPFFMDVRPPPGPASWDLPPGRSTRSWEGRPAVDGRILAVGGHLHRFGIALILEDVTAGRELLRLRPELDEDGAVSGVERRTFVGRLGVPLRRDHTYRITAVYDNPTGETIRNGGMGAIGGMIWKRGEWPAGAQENPAFMEDLEQLRTAPVVHTH
jgi:hypothetical protein